MSWLIDLKEVIFPVLLSILGILGTAYKAIKEGHTSRKNRLEEFKSLINRRSDIRNYNRFLQDLEVSNVRYLKGFNWLEIELILKRDIKILTLKNLRVLSKRQLMALKDDSIILPERSYIIIKHFKNPVSYFLIINFLCSTFALFIVLKSSPFNYLLFFGALIYTLVSEVLAIYHFDDLASLNLIKKESNSDSNKIYISRDFESVLEEYKGYQSHYYSMERLKELNTTSNDQTISE
ncbi:hypothetical protein [uncultured Psychrobacter sp.]|uniref:hypothetical protein n=1 Tax=uncultured Psychrobacter sp. TaxID=259303 RepID=UPI0034579D59